MTTRARTAPVTPGAVPLEVVWAFRELGCRGCDNARRRATPHPEGTEAA